MSEPAESESILTADRSAWRSAVRWLVRAGCLAAATLALLPNFGSPRSAAVVASLSPLVAIASIVAARTFQVLFVLGLIVGLIATFRRRWFCRWMCPTGVCTDLASRAGRRVGCRSPRLPPIGQWIAIVTLAGAVLGYPLLLWLDPLAMFSGLMSPLGPTTGWVTWACAAGVPVVLGLSFALPGIWCLRLCPLGALQELLNLASRPSVPRLAPNRGWQLARRVMLSSLLGVAWAAFARAARAGVKRPLRPPGARNETDFAGLCIRCGNCVRVCPATILEPDVGEHGIAAFLAPILRFDHDYCREDCTRCTDACPSGALERLTLPEKLLAPIGRPVVDMNVCLLGDDRDCAVCRNHCPYEAIKLVFSETEYTLTPQIDLQRCPGCGACQVACPTQPQKAIVVQPTS